VEVASKRGVALGSPRHPRWSPPRQQRYAPVAPPRQQRYARSSLAPAARVRPWCVWRSTDAMQAACAALVRLTQHRRHAGWPAALWPAGRAILLAQEGRLPDVWCPGRTPSCAWGRTGGACPDRNSRSWKS